VERDQADAATVEPAQRVQRVEGEGGAGIEGLDSQSQGPAEDGALAEQDLVVPHAAFGGRGPGKAGAGAQRRAGDDELAFAHVVILIEVASVVPRSWRNCHGARRWKVIDV